MRGQSRVRIGTHAALRSNIGVRYGVSLVNSPQKFNFLNMTQSERFAGFSGKGKRVIGARNGLILPLEEYYLDKILGVFVR